MQGLAFNPDLPKLHSAFASESKASHPVALGRKLLLDGGSHSGLSGSCDTLDAELPEEIAALLDPRGRIPILSLSLRLIARPSLIPRLWRLRKDCNRALQQLGLGVRQIIEDIRP